MVLCNVIWQEAHSANSLQLIWILVPCRWILRVSDLPRRTMICYNTLRPRQNGRHFAHDIFKCIFLNANARISFEISLKFVLKVQINNSPALVQIMAWCRPGDKPLSEPMMVSLLTHICVTRPQWVKDESPGKWTHCDLLGDMFHIYHLTTLCNIQYSTSQGRDGMAW